MKPVKFKEQNVTYAENQKEYLALPAHKSKDGNVVSCWRMTFRERIKALFGGRIWIMTMTFNKPLQPLLPAATKKCFDLGEVK